MSAKAGLSPKLQISADIFRDVQQLSVPTLFGPEFLINMLLAEALRSPEIIGLSLAKAIRQRELEQHELESRTRHAVLIDTLVARIERRPKVQQLHDTPGIQIAPHTQAIQFFSWIQEQLKTTEINQPASSIHTHQDGLLLASPRIFQDFAKATNCTWLDCQRNIFKSLFLKSLHRHHVARYRIAGRSKKFLHCVVLRAEFFGEFFGELPAPNPHILERVSW